jgi:DNA-binding transcriptional MerR regulator
MTEFPWEATDDDARPAAEVPVAAGAAADSPSSAAAATGDSADDAAGTIVSVSADGTAAGVPADGTDGSGTGAAGHTDGQGAAEAAADPDAELAVEAEAEPAAEADAGLAAEAEVEPADEVAVPVAAAAAPTRRSDAGSRQLVRKEYYSISEVSDMVGLPAHVLRYWESQFQVLNPSKNRSGNRVYQRKEIKLILLVKKLLHDDKYTVEGAKQKLDQLKRGGGMGEAAARALDDQMIGVLRDELAALGELLQVRAE